MYLLKQYFATSGTRITYLTKKIASSVLKLVIFLLIAQLTFSNKGLSYHSTKLNHNYQELSSDTHHSFIYSHFSFNNHNLIEVLDESDTEKIINSPLIKTSALLISFYFLTDIKTLIKSPKTHNTSVPIYIKYCSLKYYS